MKRALIILGLCIMFFTPSVMAKNPEILSEPPIPSSTASTGDHSIQLIEKIKRERNTIYNALNLTQEQIKQKDEIDKKRYNDLETAFRKLCLCRQNLKNILTYQGASSSAKSKEKEIIQARKDIREISNKYDKEFIKILNSDQRSKYKMIRKLKKAELNKLKSGNKKSASLKPFGIPITQADYTKQQKEKNKNFFSRTFNRQKS